MKRKVLVIDDDADLGRTLQRMLETEGFECILLESGEDLVDRLKVQPVDLVITDILMPRVEGIEIILQLRSAFPDLPVIAMSGSGHSLGRHALHSAQQLGARAVLPKPFTRQDLMAAVDQALQG